MSFIPTEEEQVIVRAVREAFERDVNPGNSVNGTPNPFQIRVIGLFDLTKIAGTVLERQGQYLASKLAAAEAAAKKEAAALEEAAKAALKKIESLA